MSEAAAPPEAEEGEAVFFPPSECFGCSETNAYGVGLRFRRVGDEIVARHRMPSKFDGAPGVVHGGMQALLLDEVMCAAVYFGQGHYGLTGSLDLRYRAACASGAALRIAARILSDEGRYAKVRGEIREASSGRLLTAAEGRFYYADPSGEPIASD